jgi:trk system potassium uptake protein TrkH
VFGEIEGSLAVDVPFEAASALGTVGLSMGRTGQLDEPSKVLVSLLMFIGRVGPFALAAALVRREMRDVAPLPPDRRIDLG